MFLSALVNVYHIIQEINENMIFLNSDNTLADSKMSLIIYWNLNKTCF